jgi:hypothetical protein
MIFHHIVSSHAGKSYAPGKPGIALKKIPQDLSLLCVMLNKFKIDTALYVQSACNRFTDFFQNRIPKYLYRGSSSV